MRKIYLVFVLAMATVFTGCEKDDFGCKDKEEEKSETVTTGNRGGFHTWYTGLDQQTLQELQRARAASARYQQHANAIRDGYVDIAVDVEGMGHHFMKQSLVDGTFNLAEPEILVYNRDEDGNYYLVAVEYALPISEPEPDGFTGSGDAWNGNAGFQLWLLHAWVWEYNPDGVFNPTNPNVHLH